MEIGSEFWLNNLPNVSRNKAPKWLEEFGNSILTSSGRGAINLLLQQVNPQYKSVLMPAYICESVILPFIENGYTCYFYKINNNFSADIESIQSFKNIGIFIHMGYFGFSTNSNLMDVLKSLKNSSIIIIEDITHTLFSEFNRSEENDYYIGSIRKWFGVPSGGFLASPKRSIKGPEFTNEVFSELRTMALINKGKYINTNDESIKSLFLNQFAEAETLLDRDVTTYSMDEFSIELINLLNVEELVSKRRKNFKVLSGGLKHVNYLKASFDELKKHTCPMFYPLLINKRRDEIRKRLTEEKIYCPIHWPIPNQIEDTNLDNTIGIYNTILSIPCDQRYGSNDMERIISVLKSI